MLESYMQQTGQIINEIKKVIVGKDVVIEKVLTAILANGHILLEDIPGVGKTTLALAFSKAMSLSHRRMQFTPDVMPSDVTGFSVYNKAAQAFEYKPGAIMCNLFLADEINRTSSKTQSALLEVMEEGKVTVDGVTHKVPQPFTVIATQNPIGSVGTHMLPESQLDRFMIKLTMGYPDIQSEINILKGKKDGNPLRLVEPVVTAEQLTEMRDVVENTYMHDMLYQYIAVLAAQTRSHSMIQLGLSPRGALALARMAKARAFIKGRDFVIPDDITDVFPDVAGHRIMLSPKSRVSAASVQDILEEIVKSVPSPRASASAQERVGNAKK